MVILIMMTDVQGDNEKTNNDNANDDFKNNDQVNDI